MGISVENVQVAVCDACGNRSYHTPEEHVPGVHASVQIHEDWGGIEFSIYSCMSTSDHVGKAFSNGLQRALDNKDDPTPILVSTSENPVPQLTWVPARVKPKSARGNPNPKTDSELMSDLQSIWVERGGRPSKDLIKKMLHIGERRADWLIDNTPDPTKVDPDLDLGHGS